MDGVPSSGFSRLDHTREITALLRYSLVWPSIVAVKIPVRLSWTASFPWALLLDNARRITAPLLPSVEH